MNYLKDEQYYFDLYDTATIKQCRFGEQFVNETFSEMEKAIKAKKIKQPDAGHYLLYSQNYFILVEAVAAQRFIERNDTVQEWMKRDSEKDHQLKFAEIAKPPFCRKCGKNMALVSKMFLSREFSELKERKEDIIFILKCRHCDNRSSFWQDGTEWKKPQTHCEKCGEVMNEKSEDINNVLTITYTCSNCSHECSHTLDLTSSSDGSPVDPLFKLDSQRFCLDEEMVGKIRRKMYQLERLANLYIKPVGPEEGIEEAIKRIKKLKISQLPDTLSPDIIKAGYAKLKVGEPQVGKDIIIGFSCMDEKLDRTEGDSAKELRNLINEILIDTNWRLMSDGINSRLGYMSGRLRAYELEEELRKLAEQRLKNDPLDKKERQPQFELKKFDIRESVQVYFEKLSVGTESIDKSKRGGDYFLTTKGVFHPDLRIVIPSRAEDNSIPEFVRRFDFVMVRKSLVSRNKQKKQARKTS